LPKCVGRGGVTDIFFSYRSVDRERVRPIHDAFAERGFEVFWDQEVPAGADWDNWIRQHLSKSKCVIVFWSAASVESDNVRHEALVAKGQGKLIPVLLEPLKPEQFPLGLHSQQAVNLEGWNGDSGDIEWGKLRGYIESKLMPPWMQQITDELAGELEAERARRERADGRIAALQTQMARELQAQEDATRKHERMIGEMTVLKASIEELTRVRSELNMRVDELSRSLHAAEQEKRLRAGDPSGTLWSINVNRIRAISKDKGLMAVSLFAIGTFIASLIGILAASGSNKIIGAIIALVSLVVVVTCYYRVR